MLLTKKGLLNKRKSLRPNRAFWLTSKIPQRNYQTVQLSDLLKTLCLATPSRVLKKFIWIFRLMRSSKNLSQWLRRRTEKKKHSHRSR